MCGIAGLFTTRGIDRELLRRMADVIAHRGPDDNGTWTDAEAGVGFTHRRLSIVDLSPSGCQPMVSADRRYVLNYNGEIYNHADLRRELESRGHAPDGGWRGTSDTETFVQAIAGWGLQEALVKAVGMFAFALWDKKERRLSLVRDRFGEKPLYYGWVGKDFVFGSELKAFLVHPRFDNAINRRALRQFVARTYIPAPLSIYERVFKLPPGCILSISHEAAGMPLTSPPGGGGAQNGLSLTRYWSYRDVVRQGLKQPFQDEGDALERLEQVLATAIQTQSIADVPVGAFLSGGIDSSTVVALYQKYSSIPVRTFSIGFEQTGFNEADDAKAVASHLGTIHNEHYVTVKEAREVIPLLGKMYDEPFADSSQIPTFLVSRFAREQVTVALTGDGGDELFAGYNRHFMAPKAWERLQQVPGPLRAAVGSMLSRLPPQFWAGPASLLPGRRQPHLGAKIQKALRVGAWATSFDDFSAKFLDEWSFELSPVIGGGGAAVPFDMDVAEGTPDATRMMYCDAVSYLPDDILCKVDRASMAVSLETRVPLLDYRVAEVAARIPLGMKIRGGRGKHILRQLLYREAPKHLFDRPKAGFAVPVGEWIKGPLRPWAEELLNPTALAGEGWLDPAIVQQRWRDHLRGRRDSTSALWAILMFQSWLEANQGNASVQSSVRYA